MKNIFNVYVEKFNGEVKSLTVSKKYLASVVAYNFNKSSEVKKVTVYDYKFNFVNRLERK